MSQRRDLSIAHQPCAIDAATRAAKAASDAMKEGEEESRVAKAIAAALYAGQVAIEEIVSNENWADELDDPRSRGARCGYAAWLLLLAGAEPDGCSRDFALAAELFAVVSTS